MPFSREDVEGLSAAFNEPDWVLERRLEAWNYFEKMELPEELEEPWRYTNLALLRFKLDKFSAVPAGARPSVSDVAEELIAKRPERSGHIVQRDTSVVLTEIDPELASQGVILSDLHTAMVQHEDLLKRHLLNQVNHSGHIFNALHAALFAGGTFLYVPRNVSVALPVESQRWIDTPGGGFFPHTLVVAEEGAQVTHFEHFRSSDLPSASLSCGGVEIISAPTSTVKAIVLQEYGRNVWHFSTQRADVGAAATFGSVVVTVGGRFSRQEVLSKITGAGAGIDMLGLYFAGQNQHFDFRTLQDHAADHSTSNLLYKGALRDDAHTVYAGSIHVRTNAAETDAYQTNRNLVLSDNAMADSKPELEIENNDVRCSHAASVGQLNEEEIFYLVSRGIPRIDAQRLIVNGFFEEVVSRITDDRLRGLLGDAVGQKV